MKGGIVMKKYEAPVIKEVSLPAALAMEALSR